MYLCCMCTCVCVWYVVLDILQVKTVNNSEIMYVTFMYD